VRPVLDSRLGPVNKYLIYYPNGIRRHVKRSERDLLASSLTQIGPREYKANSFQTEREQMTGPRYLPGKFTVEFIDRTGSRGIRAERLETVRAMTARLFRQGVLGNVVEQS
jgi:hypothetical protein